MNVEVTRLPESKVALKIDLTGAEVDQALERTYKQLVQRVKVPGFRPGKAPRPVVERLVGPEYFLHEATDDAVRWAYRKAIDQEKLVPIDEAEIGDIGDHQHLEEGAGFSFEATVTVRPEAQLPDYTTLHVERPAVEVTDEDVDALLNDLRERSATLEPTNSPADVGMVVTMNIVAHADDTEVINEDNGEYEIRNENEQGPDPVLPGLSAQLIGLKPGDIREFELPLAESYSDPAMAGKTLRVRVLGKEVKRRVLPEVNDEFAQSVSDLQTLDELRDRLRQNIEIERRMEADQKLVDQVVDEVTNRTFVEIPPILIEEELDRALGEMRQTFEAERMSLDTFFEATGKTEADTRNEMREEATQNVKRSLVLVAVANREHIEVSAREVDVALDETLRTMRMTSQERKRLRSSPDVRSNFRSRLTRQRAIQRLVEIVTGGEHVLPEATEAVADQTAATADDTEETVAVEVGG